MHRKTFERRCSDAIRLGVIHGVIATFVLIAFVFATGSTFGQRCERTYPEDQPAIDACVQRLVEGGSE